MRHIGHSRLILSLGVVVLGVALTGCPKDVAPGLVALPEMLDFGTRQTELTLRLASTYGSGNVGPIVISAADPWVTISDCDQPEDNCGARFLLGREKIKVKVNREQMTLGLNRSRLFVDAPNVSRVTVEIFAEDVLQPDFSSDVRNIDLGRPVAFRDLSQAAATAGQITAWLWDFGDGTTSSEINPTHLYVKPGVYDVSLTVTAGRNQEKITKYGYVRVGDPGITVDFQASKTEAYLNEQIVFTDLTVSGSVPMQERLWDFGDGNTSKEANPAYRYARTGIYTVTLKVKTALGEFTRVRNNYIKVSAALPPTADFALASPVVYVNEVARFFDTSRAGTGAITAWAWDFGDGTTSTEQNPTHVFPAVKTYPVTLTVTTPFGSSAVTRNVDVTYRPPQADFEALPVVVAIGESVQFTDLSIPGTSDITQWLWNFGDGNQATEQNPAHVYNREGQYTVTLTITSADPANNTSSKTKENFITVVRPPVPDFTYMPAYVLAGDTVQFSAATTQAGSEPITQYLWDFDGNLSTTADQKTGLQVSKKFEAAETYTVTLAVRTATLIRVIAKEIIVEQAPSSDFTAAPLPASVLDDVQFTPAMQPEGALPITRVAWSFGDGTSSQEEAPAHRYTVPGSYKVRRTVYFRHSQMPASAADLSVFTEKPNYVVVTPPVAPVVSFAPDFKCAVTTMPATFRIVSTNEPSRPITRWIWNFGDGSVPLELTSDQDVSHQYQAPGSYEVSLTVICDAMPPEYGERTYTLDEPIKVEQGTDLDAYVRMDDGAYAYSLVSDFPVSYEGFNIGRAYIISMTSQQWRTSVDIYTGDGVRRDLWTHYITIVDPTNRKSDTGLLFIDGGSRSSTPPTTVDDYFKLVAGLTGVPVALVKNIPSQPIVFTDEVTAGDSTEESLILRSRTEDAIIAYSMNKYMESYTAGAPDPTWPLLFPMAKAAVKAMDTVQAVMAERNRPVKDFVVSGASKRGWTTWLTGVADCRVKAIAPIVIDVLNMAKQMRHHKQAYGYWAPSIYEYAQERVFDRLVPESGSLAPEAEALLKLVDPYEYALLGRLDEPKYLINGTGDQFFLPDSSQWYFADLPGEKYLNYVPNADHGLLDVNAEVNIQNLNNVVGQLAGWIMSVTQNKARPSFTYTVDRVAGTITVNVDPARRPRYVRLWYATTSNARDFRIERGSDGSLYNPDGSLRGPQWYSLTLTPTVSGGTTYVASRPQPPAGLYTGFFVQVGYANTATLPSGLSSIPGVTITVPDLVFTTDVLVIPTAGDGSNLYPEFPGYLANVERPDVVNFPADTAPVVVLTGSPYEMGRQYGELLADKIAEFVPNWVSSFQAATGVTDVQMDQSWANQAALMDPAIVEEINGIADGSGVDLTLLRRAHVVFMRESATTWGGAAMAAWRKQTSNAATLHAVTLNGPTLTARSWTVGSATRYPQDYGCVVVYIPETGVPHALLTFTGLAIGRTGVNLGGISFSETIDSGSTDLDLSKLNFAFTARELLGTALNLEEAIDFFRVPTHYPQRAHYFVLADGRNYQRGAVLRVTPSGLQSVQYNQASLFPNITTPRNSGVTAAAQNAANLNTYVGVINPLVQPLDRTDAYTIATSAPPADNTRNTLNVVYNTDDFLLEILFSYASQNTPARQRPSVSFDLQQLLP
ncbi:MAG TPA: C45 family autoproteolytic acyltransferase/hydrolase [Candidatus Hydrogenedentes bacterium]|nr:C45 family autoproteolytic acyltransferase/hydrolase [Candidatus Hydrogenedentota bacterium]